MPTTFIQRDTASDLSAPGEYDLQLLETTTTEVQRTVSLAATETKEGYHYTEPGVPGAAGVTGDYTVEVDIAVGDNQVNVSAAVGRVDSAGTLQQQTAFSAEQVADGTVQTHSFTAVDLGTWATGDRLRVAVRYRNAHSKTARTVDVGFNTIDAEVVAPWGVVSGGSTATVNVAATGGGQTTAGAWTEVVSATTDAEAGVSGGSTVTVSVTASGAGVKQTSNGVEASVSVSTQQAGVKSTSGSSTPVISVSTEQTGVKTTQDGSTAGIMATSEGDGEKSAQGAAEATVTATASGDGTKATSGGVGATVTVTATGGGTKVGDNPQGGSTVSVNVLVESSGSKHVDDGATETATASADGDGEKGAQGSTTVNITVTATGGGNRVGGNPQGGSVASVTVSTEGDGAKTALGGTTETATVAATSSGSKFVDGSATIIVTVTALAGGRAGDAPPWYVPDPVAYTRDSVGYTPK